MISETITTTKKTVVEKIENGFEIGYSQNISDKGDLDIKIPFMRSIKPLWFSHTPVQILKLCGVETTERRAQDLSNLFEGSLLGYYYVANASTNGSDESAKMLLGYISETFKSKNINIFRINYVIPSVWLKGLIDALEDNRVPKKFQKNFIDELIAYEDKSTNINDVLNELLKDPKYTVMDSSLIDGLIDKVFAENPQAVEDAKINPKKSGFLVGQVMKISGGKASPQEVSKAIGERLNDN